MEFSAKKIKKLRSELEKLLEGEKNSVISSPINPQCRIVVLIPVYNEEIETLLRPLLSLAAQKDITPDLFEVMIVINNNLNDALTKNEVFLSNQAALKFINLINTPNKKLELRFNKKYQAALKKIRQSKIIVHAVDKSSPQNAEPENCVAHARNRGSLEASVRFLNTPIGLKGVIAMTDADTKVSTNYIRTLIDIYTQYPFLNGVAGITKHEIDTKLTHSDLVEQAFVLHTGRSVNSLMPNEKIIFRRGHKLNHQILVSGQDLTVTIKSWLLAGGVPDRLSGEDFGFGRLVADLPGDIASTNLYTTFPLIRISERAGIGSYGRRVKRIHKSICGFMEGKAKAVFVPDTHNQKLFLDNLLKKAKGKKLTARSLKNLMTKYGLKTEGISVDILNGTAEMATQEMTVPTAQRNYKRLEAYLIDVLYEHFPRRDITSSLKLTR